MLLLHLCKCLQGRSGFSLCAGAVPAAVVPSCPPMTPGGIGMVYLAACEPHPHPADCLFSKLTSLYCSSSPAANLCMCLLAVSVHTSTGQRPSLPLCLKGTPGPLQQCSPSGCPQKQSFIPVSNPFGPSHISKTRLDSLLLLQWGGCQLACCKPKLVTRRWIILCHL